jgi:hypothetical protein
VRWHFGVRRSRSPVHHRRERVPPCPGQPARAPGGPSTRPSAGSPLPTARVGAPTPTLAGPDSGSEDSGARAPTPGIWRRTLADAVLIQHQLGTREGMCCRLGRIVNELAARPAVAKGAGREPTGAVGDLAGGRWPVPRVPRVPAAAPSSPSGRSASYPDFGPPGRAMWPRTPATSPGGTSVLALLWDRVPPNTPPSGANLHSRVMCAPRPVADRSTTRRP